MNRKCAYHPDVEASYWCAKHEKYLCDDCLKCQDPGGYCKFRTSCIIWEMVKHGMPDDESVPASEQAQVGGHQ